MAGNSASELGRGGMITKVLAARRAARSGADTIIASGKETNVLLRLLDGEAIGTKLTADTTPLAARKQWLADHVQLSGQLHIDQGAVKALSSRGTSLLPIGVREVAGDFDRGAIVSCIAPDGREIARGLVNYSAAESRRISGKSSEQIKAVLGYVDEDELIHRDNLVLL
jgi:glutamate 5-kinase